MNPRALAIGTIGLFVLWSALDYVIHGLLLSPYYASTAGLFRPMEDMRMPLLYGTVLVGALGYTLLYGLGGARAALRDSLLFGLWFGLATGFGMGFGTYATMPIPLEIAWGWFLGSLVESLAAAVLLHWAFRPKAA